MFKSIVWVVALLFFKALGIDNISVGSIRNVSLLFSNSSSLLINATCTACLCQLYSNANFTSFNCYSNNQSCRMHQKSDQNQSFLLMSSSVTTLYFLSLPNVQSIVDTPTCVHTVNGSIEYLWPFDSLFNDLSSTLNFTSMNGAGYSSSTITGYGMSLSLNASQSQFLTMSKPCLDLSNSSWTFELWIYAQSLSNVFDSSLIGQCQSWTFEHCLHLVIRNQKCYFGFYGDDVAGVQTLVPLRWYHLAFVFDCDTRKQSIYVDGFTDNSHQAYACYQGDERSLMIGYPEGSWLPGQGFYDGLIDQLSYISRSKTAEEILRDASLTVYFPFDNSSTADGGPLGIDGSLSGSMNFTSGRVGGALQIYNVPDSYFRVSGLVLLGRTNQSYSLVIWIRPSSQGNATIIHVSSNSSGRGWCVPMLTLTSSGQLRAISWSGGAVMIMGPTVLVNQGTHAVVTYNANNGLRLYVNGTLRNASLPFSYIASGTANYLFLGSSLSGTDVCAVASMFNGQYAGLVDELRVYSREMSAEEVVDLANA